MKLGKGLGKIGPKTNFNRSKFAGKPMSMAISRAAKSGIPKIGAPKVGIPKIGVPKVSAPSIGKQDGGFYKHMAVKPNKKCTICGGQNTVV